jgi:hypothetical protein
LFSTTFSVSKILFILQSKKLATLITIKVKWSFRGVKSRLIHSASLISFMVNKTIPYIPMLPHISTGPKSSMVTAPSLSIIKRVIEGIEGLEGCLG